MSIKLSLISTSSELQRLVEAAVDLTTTSKKKSEFIEAYGLAFSQVEDVIASIPPKVATFANTKRSLRIINNLLGGTLDGLHTSEISLKELKGLAQDLLNEKLPVFLETVSEDVTRHNTKYGIESDVTLPITPTDSITESLTAALNFTAKKSKNSLSSSKTFKEALGDAIIGLKTGSSERLADTTSPLEDDVATSDKKGDVTRKFLQGLSAYKATIPVTLGKTPFTILRLPIVPVFHAVDRSSGQMVTGLGMNVKAQPNPTYILKQSGIRATAVEEYVVIADQLMLVVNKKALPSNEVQKGKRVIDVSTKPLDYAKLVLSTLAESTPNQYVLVDETPVTNPRNPDTLLYWIMPAKTLSFLLRKGFPKILQWGLPF